jgi:hypothetical protein
METAQFADNKELTLIILLLRCQLNTKSGNKAQIAKLVREPEFDWNEFLRLVKFHKVYPHIYDPVKTLNCFPETIITALKRFNIDNSRNALAITNELKTINQLFGDNGINFMVFKGQPLSLLLYGNTTRRGSKDIDLLVDSNDLKKIIKLFAADYLEITPLKLPLEYIKLYYNHLVFKNRQTGVIIEVHWKLLHYTHLAPGFTKDTIQNITHIDIAGTNLNLPVFHYHLFYCLMHGVNHSWFRLFWLMDIAVFCRKDEFALNKLLAMGEKYNVSDALGSALLLCNQLFSEPELEENHKISLMENRKINQLCEMYLNHIMLGKIRPDSSYLKLAKWKLGTIYKDILLKKDPKYLVELVNNHFISSADIEALPLPGKLFFLYYPLHFILATVRWYNEKTIKNKVTPITQESGK